MDAGIDHISGKYAWIANNSLLLTVGYQNDLYEQYQFLDYPFLLN